MAAYNDVNGVAATEQDELNNGVLKSEWGWDGLLMSDWGATKTAGPAADGGLDLVMPGPDGPWGSVLVAVGRGGRGRRGDDRRSRVAGCSGWPAGSGRWTAIPPSGRPSWLPPPAPTDRGGPRRAAHAWPAAGMVLLKGQDVLPLDESAITDEAPVVLVGRHGADTPRCRAAARPSVRPPHEISIAHGLTEALGRQPGPGGRRGGGPAEPAARGARPGDRPADRQPRGADRQLRRGRAPSGVHHRRGRPRSSSAWARTARRRRATSSCRPG